MNECVLIVNAGSSSLKLSLHTEGEVIHGKTTDVNDFEKAFSSFLQYKPSAIGHRVVHGGTIYTTSTWIDQEVIDNIQKLANLAPLHNSISLKAIKYCQKHFPLIPQYGTFDTSFHRTLPIHARSYAIPSAISDKYGIQRFGFHGIAHAHSYKTFADAYTPVKAITCHLGSGCSITAIDKGISIDTSMGFTPNEGLMMSTRSGDVDPGLFKFLSQQGYDINTIHEMLNLESGILGVSGISSSMKEVINVQSEATRLKSLITQDLFSYRVLKTIGSYFAVLQGADAILFTGGIGENSPEIRHKILAPLRWLGVNIDPVKNNLAKSPKPSEIFEINDDKSNIKVCVIGSDENGFIYDQYTSFLKKLLPQKASSWTKK